MNQLVILAIMIIVIEMKNVKKREKYQYIMILSNALTKLKKKKLNEKNKRDSEIDNIWKRANAKQEIEKTKDEEFEEYFIGLFE